MEIEKTIKKYGGSYIIVLTKDDRRSLNVSVGDTITVSQKKLRETATDATEQ